ncbi:NicO-domain-containing protein [Hyaloscypha variabilis F]|uniref:Nickel/cobalt efflux system n=1 Tax=Hyaloscypha variabilis (strain UAMH 11265 / GT02V1 / F) TaxID=1149755 RepID=A0A2J6RQ22_HYAVF|nr:NicO-domain-containing protein [Hyaloscypha variabilis F]
MTKRLVVTGSQACYCWHMVQLVAAASIALERRFKGLRNVGGIIGMAVSVAVLILLGIANAWILAKLIQRRNVLLREEVGGDREDAEEDIVAGLNLEGGGIMVRIFKKLFKLIDRRWKMYALGVLFGLGFDTSSEVAVMGLRVFFVLEGQISAPVPRRARFSLVADLTAGMCLLDTTDVLVAMIIGMIQLPSVVANYSSGPFWDDGANVGDHFDVIGGGICGAFVVFGAASVLLYRPWRRRYDRRSRFGVEAEAIHIK